MRLTPFARVFIALVIASTIGYIAWSRYHRSASSHDEHPPAAHRTEAVPAHPPAAHRTEAVPLSIGVLDPAGAFAGIVANDGKLPGPRSRFKARGVDARFELSRSQKDKLAGFERGDINVLLLSLDEFASLEPTY